MKHMFDTFIDQLSNDELKAITHQALDNIPEYFWYVPASSTGLHHPAFDLGYGGLVRHTVMVTRVALELLRKSSANPMQILIDDAIVSSIFHDSFKNGETDTGHTVHEHPILAANFVSKTFYSYNKEFANVCAHAISCHMGRWATNPYSPVILPTPTGDFDKLLHTADYIASRKFMAYVPEGDL